MSRRRFLNLAAFGIAGVLYGCNMSSKKNIRSFGKTFAYLQDPALRTKETGDALLVVENAEFSGTRFDDVTWRNVTFRHCNFVGAYEIKPESIERALFEDCKFAGIFNLGTLKQVQFVRCLIEGTSHVVGDVGSIDVVFDSCEMMGKDPEPNHWGSFGAYGEVAFVNCKAKQTNLTGETKHVIRDCIFEDIHCGISKDGGGSIVLIENSKLKGLFRLAPASLQSLTIRDTVIDNLDLSKANVKGDILMERVKGGYINAYVKQAKSLTVRDSQIYGNGKKVFEAFAGGIQTIEISNVTFGGDPLTEPVTIAGGTGMDLNNVRARVNNSIVIRNSRIPLLSTHHIHTSLFLLQACSVDSLNASSSLMDKLEVSGNTFARTVDFTHTQARQSKVQALAKGQAKLDGSNVKVG